MFGIVRVLSLCVIERWFHFKMVSRSRSNLTHLSSATTLSWEITQCT